METEQNKSEEEAEKNESESEEMDEKLDSGKENGIIENSGTTVRFKLNTYLN